MSMDDFLAAPESVEKNELERKRALERKQHLEAEELREKNSKLPGEPTIEQLCADIIRVAESEYLNPLGYKDKAISRKRYARLGGWYIRDVERQFGTFAHALEVAGLRQKRGTRKWKFARAEESRREHAGRYQESYMAPYVYDPLQREVTGTECILSISDTHATYLDPFTWHCFLRAVQHLEPDIIVANGDLLEGSEISRYPKIPGRTVPLQIELDFIRSMFAQMRSLAPDALIYYVAGNHGLDRLASYLTQVSPALAGLDNLRFDKLVGLEEFDIKLAQGGSFISPKGQENARPGVLLHPDYEVYHGTATGQNPALSELKSAGRSGQSGHVHRASVVYGTNEALGAHSWMTTPCGCSDRAGRAYLGQRRNYGWQQGFGLAFLSPDGRVQQQPIVTTGGFAAFEGLCLQGDGESMPHDRNWLPDWWASSPFSG